MNRRMRLLLILPLLVAGCSSAKQYVQSASQYMQDDCTSRETFEEVFVCTKNRMYNDPTSSIAPNPAVNTEVSAYGEQLSSQLRQHLITDAQAKQAFAQELESVKARRIPAPVSVQ